MKSEETTFYGTMAFPSMLWRNCYIRLLIIGLAVISVILYNYFIRGLGTKDLGHSVARSKQEMYEYQPSWGYNKTNSSIPTTCLPKKSCEASQLRKELPTVILIGEQKTGTGTIRAFLETLNSRVSFAGPGESHFWDMVLPPKIFQHKSHLGKDGEKAYKDFMKPSCPGDVVLEKTPRYFRIPGVEESIYKFNPNIKLMLSLRDPIDRLVSGYHFMARMPRKYTPYYAEHSCEEIVLTKDGQINTSFVQVMTSVYDVNLERWLKYFPLKQIHIIDADNFIIDPATELTKIEEYIGLEPMCTKDKFVYDREKGFFCIRGCPCLDDEKGHKNHTKLSDHLLGILKDFYAPHVKNLQTLIGRTLSWMPKYL